MDTQIPSTLPVAGDADERQAATAAVAEAVSDHVAAGNSLSVKLADARARIDSLEQERDSIRDELLDAPTQVGMDRANGAATRFKVERDRAQDQLEQLCDAVGQLHAALGWLDADKATWWARTGLAVPASLQAALLQAAPQAVAAPDGDGTQDPARDLAVALLTAGIRTGATLDGSGTELPHAYLSALHLLMWVRGMHPDVAARKASEIAGADEDHGVLDTWARWYGDMLRVDVAALEGLAERGAVEEFARQHRAGSAAAATLQAIVDAIDSGTGPVARCEKARRIACEAIAALDSGTR